MLKQQHTNLVQVNEYFKRTQVLSYIISGCVRYLVTKLFGGEKKEDLNYYLLRI